jgi:hypothetical protein
MSTVTNTKNEEDGFTRFDNSCISQDSLRKKQLVPPQGGAPQTLGTSAVG